VSNTPTPSKNIPQIRSSTEFARYVGLARTTVSRVLNGQPGLKKKTIERVQRAIEETGFVPNAYALHLKGKKTASVGVCMETLFTPTVTQKLALLQRKLRDHNYASLIEVMEPGSTRNVVRHFLSMRVDAVVFIGHFDEEQLARHLAELRANATPHVVVDHIGIKGANTVALDRVRGMAGVMDHLLEMGHTRFGLLGFSGTVRSVRDRVRGIRQALAARGIEFDQNTVTWDNIHPRNNDFDFGRLCAQSFLEQGRPCSALVALNDSIAVGAMRGLQEQGIKVPADVSIVGFNNQDICHITTPGLTSVDQRMAETVDAAADVILTQIGKPLRQRPIVRMVEPALVVRGSTGAAPKV
jgi:DNA-binding LacI/PurR family transcriptional regulator